MKRPHLDLELKVLLIAVGMCLWAIVVANTAMPRYMDALRWAILGNILAEACDSSGTRAAAIRGVIALSVAVQALTIWRHTRHTVIGIGFALVAAGVTAEAIVKFRRSRAKQKAGAVS